MNIELKEFELDWPSGISIFELKSHVLSELVNHGQPLRWAITSLTHNSGETTQKIFIEAVFIINKDKKKDINTDLY